MCPRLVPRASAPRFALRSGGRTQPGAQVVQIYFYFELYQTTLVSRFLAQIFMKPPKRLKKISETTSQKINARFPSKTNGLRNNQNISTHRQKQSWEWVDFKGGVLSGINYTQQLTNAYFPIEVRQ